MLFVILKVTFSAAKALWSHKKKTASFIHSISLLITSQHIGCPKPADVQIFPEPPKVTRNKQEAKLHSVIYQDRERLQHGSTRALTEADFKARGSEETEGTQSNRSCEMCVQLRRFCPIFAGRLWLLHKDSYKVFDPPPPLL